MASSAEIQGEHLVLVELGRQAGSLVSARDGGKLVSYGRSDKQA
jgi:hypothetical protein